MAYNARYWVCVHAGQSARLDRLADDVFEVAEAHGLQGYLTLGRYMKIMVALAQGDRAQARHYATLATGSSTSGQFAHILGVFALLDTLDLYIEGRFDEAEQAVVGLAGQLAAIGDGNAHGLRPDGPPGHRDHPRRHRNADRRLRGRLEGPGDRSRDLLARPGGRRADRGGAGPLAARRAALPGRLPVARADDAGADRDGPRPPPGRAGRPTSCSLPLAGEMAGLSSGSVTHGPVDHFLGDLARYLGDEEAARRHYAAAAEIAERVGSAFWADRAREALTRR